MVKSIGKDFVADSELFSESLPPQPVKTTELVIIRANNNFF